MSTSCDLNVSFKIEHSTQPDKRYAFILMVIVESLVPTETLKKELAIRMFGRTLSGVSLADGRLDVKSASSETLKFITLKDSMNDCDSKSVTEFIENNLPELIGAITSSVLFFADARARQDNAVKAGNDLIGELLPKYLKI